VAAALSSRAFLGDTAFFSSLLICCDIALKPTLRHFSSVLPLSPCDFFLTTFFPQSSIPFFNLYPPPNALFLVRAGHLFFPFFFLPFTGRGNLLDPLAGRFLFYFSIHPAS